VDGTLAGECKLRRGVDDLLHQGAEALEKTLREKPWMEGMLRAIGVNPRTGPMPPLSPAEQGCKQMLDRQQQRCTTETSQYEVAGCSADALKRDMDQCVASLQEEWLKIH
jgi:hypothetical protein